MAETVKDSIDVEASAQELFDIATDFDTYPEWTNGIKKAEIKETDSQGRPTLVWFEVDARIKTVRYTLRYDYSDAPESFSWELEEGEVKDLKGSYRFDEFDDVTEVTYELSIEPGFRVPGVLRRQAERQIVKGALDDLKKRAESLSG